MLSQDVLASEALSLARGMVTGKVAGLTEKTYFQFGISGLAHALSASGFHLLSAIMLLKALQYPWKFISRDLAEKRSSEAYYLNQILVFALVLVFTLASGGSSPTVRASGALLLCLMLASLGLRPRIGFVFVLASILALAVGRGSFLSLVLSLVATASFYWGLQFVSAKAPPWKKVSLLLFAPWLATHPIIIWNFHTLSVAAPLVNFFFAPWLSFPVLFPGISALFLSLSPLQNLESAAWGLATLALEPFLKTLEWLSQSVTLALWVPKAPWLLGLVSLSGAWFGAKYIKFRLCAIACVVIFMILGLEMNEIRAQAVIFNVGQGDAIALKTPRNEPFLVDFGGKGKAPYPSKAALHLGSLGRSRLAGLLLTHPDADHAGGLESLLLRHKIEQKGFLWLSRSHFKFQKIDRVIRLAERYRVPIKILGDAESPYPGLSCHSIPAEQINNSNSSSPLCSFSLGGDQKFLMTGDLSQTEEAWFLHRLKPNFFKASHLKVGHHGSKSSSSDWFLKLVGAKQALVSVGRRNSYNHPHPILVKRLKAYSLEVLTTASEGNISIP